MKFNQKNNLYLVNVDVSASRGRNVNINQIKFVFFIEFHFEIVYRSTYSMKSINQLPWGCHAGAAWWACCLCTILHSAYPAQQSRHQMPTTTTSPHQKMLLDRNGLRNKTAEHRNSTLFYMPLQFVDCSCPGFPVSGGKQMSVLLLLFFYFLLSVGVLLLLLLLNCGEQPVAQVWGANQWQDRPADTFKTAVRTTGNRSPISITFSALLNSTRGISKLCQQTLR